MRKAPTPPQGSNTAKPRVTTPPPVAAAAAAAKEEEEEVVVGMNSVVARVVKVVGEAKGEGVPTPPPPPLLLLLLPDITVRLVEVEEEATAAA